MSKIPRFVNLAVPDSDGEPVFLDYVRKDIADDLLEALELMVSTHEEGGWPTATITIARAAIAKARGEA